VVRDVWQKVLIEMLGVAWKEQDYVIGYRPKSEEKHDLGFNVRVGSKFPKKALPLDRWKDLEREFRAAGYSVSWQEGHDDLLEYMEWLHSCRLILTQDSLGLHIALALKKKVVALFGPTDPREVCTYGNAILLRSATNCPFAPCYAASKCRSGAECMANMDLGGIVEAVETLIGEDAEASGRVHAKIS
jgi:heptosyltransferase-2